MNKRDETKLSKLISKILRHSPEEYGLHLDEYGYAEIEQLTAAIQKEMYWKNITKEDILEIAKKCPKQRFLIRGNKIKARYGHSIPIILEESVRPIPAYLYHGSNQHAVESILGKQEGILPMGRQYVHLSESKHFATLAAKRRKAPILLKIDTKIAIKEGTAFYYAGNEVWLSTPISPLAIAEQIII
jgi:putative RNA 2'-phosphotransferase